MHKFITILTLIFTCTCSYALTLDDIIRLSDAKVGNEIILSVIEVSKDKPELSTNDIIRLKKAGVSTDVITALIKSTKAEKKAKVQKVEKVVKEQPVNFSPLTPPTEERELKPFDKFFLSTYYSHQYGFPAKDYDSPADILGQGLYYSGRRKHYPNARFVRVYGGGYSVTPGQPFGLTYSPYSIIIPRDSYHRSSYNPHLHFRFNYNKKKK